MAAQYPFPGAFAPGAFIMTTSPTVDLGLETVSFERTLTYGQIKGMKGLLRLVKKLNERTKFVDLAVNETNFGQPGSPNTYRVRMRYRE